MEESGDKDQEKKIVYKVITFPVPFTLRENQENITIITNTPKKISKEQIINQAFKFHSQGNIKEAVRYYQDFIDQGLSDDRVFSNYGIILKNLGKLQEAELYTRKAITLNPNFEEAHSNLGSILRDLGKLQEAELSLRKAIEIKPDFAEAHYNLGSTLKDISKLKEAEFSYRKAIEIKPDFAEAYYNLGNTLKNLGKLQEAEISFSRAIELNPDLAEAYNNLGNILKDLGKLQEAELSTRKAIELNPNEPKAHLNLGTIFSDLSKLQEAELSTRKAIELNPDFAEAHSNLGSILIKLGNLQEAELSTRKAIELNPNEPKAHLNLGTIFSDLGKLQEAELSTRKAIELNPDFAMAHSNLGSILRDLGKLQESELSYRKAIEINPKLEKAYFNLSGLKYSNSNNDIWKNQLFSENILNNKSQVEQIDIYFARANILHKEKNYEESSRYLKLANKLKLDIKPSQPEMIFNKSKILLIESNKKGINQEEQANPPESIFIVGMFRSGSTLLESVLSMRDDLYDLGEINILEESFVESKKSKQEINLAELYWKKVNNKTELLITTNKNLFNYQYTGIIAKKIPNAKIIHCFRNPLDNILSIYRAHFDRGNEYSSSLVDCARVYLDQENIMTEYKNRFRSQIYDLNYDSLVSDTNKEIQSLISWLGWEWHDKYLSPHLNPRSVSTASSVQVRSPINSKSIGGWKNYKDMLKPAIEILTQMDKYQDITS
ncbi:tetratricopeptide repeat-containing sulfotransferase family protein [Prochlorococcus marinus]|uniref:tetratricopeptide repeat-containing sulfotransferase family protein n=1 Tax=Prochlorococcus marinus TaxID=1219 RepID=UPI0022B3C605|nr:tetratricopeptide repeat-containing sulfotransferase family protein [Prochlorococcus marinus]